MVQGLFAGVVLVYFVIQVLDSIVITPNLVGGKVARSALAAIFSLIIGDTLPGSLNNCGDRDRSDHEDSFGRSLEGLSATGYVQGTIAKNSYFGALSVEFP